MSLDASQTPVNGLETPQQDSPATGATKVDTAQLSKNQDSSVADTLDDQTHDANNVKDSANGTAASETTAGQPLEAAKPKEPIEPTKAIQPEAPLPKSDSDSAGASTGVKNNGVSTAQETPGDKEANGAEKMDVDSSNVKLPANDPTTIGDVPAKDSEGQDVDQAKVDKLAAAQETVKHGHDDDHAAVEEQPPAKRQRTGSAKEKNGVDKAETPKRSMSKKKEVKKATTTDAQPRRSSRLAS